MPKTTSALTVAAADGQQAGQPLSGPVPPRRPEDRQQHPQRRRHEGVL